MNKEILTRPSGDVITLEDMKAWAVIEHDLDDNLLSIMINGALDLVELETCRLLRQRDARYYFNSFEEIGIDAQPVNFIIQIQYVDVDGVTQVLSPTVYEDNLPNCTFAVSLADGESWPELQDGVNKVFIDVSEGYDCPPESLVNAAYFIAAHWYRTREGVAGIDMDVVPYTAEHLIARHRVYTK